MQAIRPVLRQLISKNAGSLSSNGHVASYHHGDHKEATMDDLPVPQGDWREQYDRRNRKYNTVLIVGVLALGTSIAVAKESGLIELHSKPPATYE